MLLLFASISNKENYYIKSADGGVEILRGSFAPLGKTSFITIPGIEYKGKIKTVYTKKDAFPLIFEYYINQADLLLKNEGTPDFDGIKLYLNKALSFGVADEQMNAAKERINRIDSIFLLYMAEIALAKDKKEDLEIALGYLEKAAALTSVDKRAKMIDNEIEFIEKKLAALKTKPAEVSLTETVKESVQEKPVVEAEH